METGLLGELAVEIALVERGWRVQRLDTSRMSPNADLIAINKQQRVSLQVKTISSSGHSHKEYLQFGYCGRYLEAGGSFFNAKESPIIADIVVGVAYSLSAPRFVILPVALAEILCRHHADYWSTVPKRSGNKRSANFPCYLNFSGEPSMHTEHHQTLRNILESFEGNWSLLNSPVKALHDYGFWGSKLGAALDLAKRNAAA